MNIDTAFFYAILISVSVDVICYHVELIEISLDGGRPFLVIRVIEFN